MRVIIEKNYEKFSETIAAILIAEMFKDRRVNIDLTDGSTPQGAYDIVEEFIKNNQFNCLDNVHYYNHDELEGEKQIVSEILKKQVHEPFMVKEQNIHKLDFENIDKQIADIEASGGLDLMLLGLGADGHFCANFPDATEFDKKAYIYNCKDYDWYDEYCQNYGMELKRIATFGFKMLLETKKVVVAVNGAKKAQAVYNILTQPISPKIPGTILRLHPNLILILDEEAATKINQEIIENVVKY